MINYIEKLNELEQEIEVLGKYVETGEGDTEELQSLIDWKITERTGMIVLANAYEAERESLRKADELARMQESGGML